MSDNQIELLLQIVQNQNIRIDNLTQTVTTLFTMLENQQKALEGHQGVLEEIEVLLNRLPNKDMKVTFN
jgi:hypothetical protein